MAVTLNKSLSNDSGGKILAVILILLLIPLLWLSASRGIAGATGYFLEREMNRWNAPNQKPDLARWNEAHDLFERAENLTPDDPQLLAQGAELFEWRAWLEQNNPEAGEEYRQRSMSYHRRGLALRPAWPYAWTDFASAKVLSGEFDKEFQGAFQKATELGPWEVGVQQVLTRIGLQNWRKLSQNNKDRLLVIMANAMVVQENPFFALVDRLESLPMVCFLLEENPTAFAHCKKNHLF